MTNNFSQRATPSAAAAGAPTWTDDVPSKVNAARMFHIMTGLPDIEARMSEIKGSQYMFSSKAADGKETYYLWNTVNETGGQITSPMNLDAIKNQIMRDIRKVQVGPLPNQPESDEE
ncbi:hypothetical protein L218DRAFT_946179 [Marasmius fiardii PR-910]|nr:hypothetical protein L218DRAFT_946179 [Marasmius fiardii PR-910]